MTSAQGRKYYEIIKFSIIKDMKDYFYQGFHVRENNVEFMTPSFLTNFLPNLLHFLYQGCASAKPRLYAIPKHGLLFPNPCLSSLFLQCPLLPHFHLLSSLGGTIDMGTPTKTVFYILLVRCNLFPVF